MKLTAFILLAGILGLTPSAALAINHLTGIDPLLLALTILIIAVGTLTKVRRALWKR